MPPYDTDMPRVRGASAVIATSNPVVSAVMAPSSHSRKLSPGSQTRDRTTVTILGVGQMGLVCANILAAPDRLSSSPVAVRLWGHNLDEAGRLAQTRRSPRLPGLILHDDVRVAISDADALAGANVIVSAIPVQYIRSAWDRLRPHVPTSAAIVSVAKGIENGTLLRPLQVIADVMSDDPDGRPRDMGVLSGPTIAAELARCLPATMVAASEMPAFAECVQELFATSWLRVYTHPDTLGVELAGATKNIIAIAAGILDGLSAGFNAKSALLARGLAEIARLGAALGAQPETFFGIAGVGDLATSCFSPEGRNRSCGEALGRGEPLADYLARTTSVVEGVATTRSVLELAQRARVEMPITAAVHAVLFESVDPLTAIAGLMRRELKGERIG